MEHNLEKTMHDSFSKFKQNGCLIANSSGLCIESKGIDNLSSGLFVSILNQAMQLEPNSNAPVLVLEGRKRSFILTKHGVNAVLCKKNIDRTG